MMYECKDDILGAIVARRQRERSLGPVEELWEHTTLKRILSTHNGDLAFLSLVYVAVITCILMIVFRYNNGDLNTLIGSAAVGAFVGLIGHTYDVAVKRLGTVDLFISEMLSIGRVFVAANIIGAFICIYDKIDAANKEIVQRGRGAVKSRDQALPSGFADASRKENYFSIFEKNCHDLGALNPRVVDDVTAFYTFLKAARDATGSMTLWKEPHYDVAKKKNDVINIIYLCFLMTIHGKLALKELIESKNNRTIAGRILSGVELQCFAFLIHVLPEDDFRRDYVTQRSNSCMALFDIYKYDFKPKEIVDGPSSAATSVKGSHSPLHHTWDAELCGELGACDGLGHPHAK